MIVILEKMLLNNPFAKWEELRSFNVANETEAVKKAEQCISSGNTYRLVSIYQSGNSNTCQEIKRMELK